MAKDNIRSVARIIQSVRTLEGAGFLVNRPFPTPELSDFDPFLLLDEMGPVELGAGEAKGAPDHPHRGSRPSRTCSTARWCIATRMAIPGSWATATSNG